MTPQGSTRRLLATALDGISFAAIAALLWQAMFGKEQTLDPMAFRVGVVSSVACLMAPGARRWIPWPLAVYAALALLSGAMFGGLWGPPPGRPPADSVPPYPVIMALLTFGIAHGLRSPLRIAAGTFALTAMVLVIGIQILYDRFRTGMVFDRGGSISLPLVEQWGGLHQTGFLLAIVLPVPMAVALLGRSVAQRVAGGLLTMTVVGIGFINGSRTSVAVMAVTTVVMMLLVVLRRGAGRRHWIVVSALFATMVVAGAVGERINKIDGPIALTLKILSNDSELPLAEKITGDRWPIWQAAAAMVRDHPLTGVGLRGYFRAMQDGGYAVAYLPNHPEIAHAGSVQAHNAILHGATELGIPGGVALLLLWASVIATAWRSWKAGWLPVIALGLTGAAVACFVRLLGDAFLDNVFAAEKARVVVALLFGLIIALGRSTQRIPIER